MRLNRCLCLKLPIILAAMVISLVLSDCSFAQATSQDRAQRLQQLMQRLDKNQDKQVTRDEVPERMLERFAKMDQDGDGAITSEEVKVIIQRMTRNSGAKKGAGKKGKNSKGKNKKGDQKKSDDANPKQNKSQGDAKGKAKKRRSKKGNGKKAEPMDTEAVIDRMMTRLDKNEDGFITRDEAPKQLEKSWQRFDTNENGKLEGEELETLRRTMRSRELDKKTKAKKNSRYDVKSFGGVKPKRPGSNN